MIIKHRYSNEVIYEDDSNTIKETVENAVKNKVSLRNADLKYANLYDADLYGANLSYANLYHANLKGTNLKSANLKGANLIGAKLYHADLEYANLKGADLIGADLEDANLYHTYLNHADLKGANLKGANLDFSCLPLWCGSANIKIDERIARQLAAHTFNLIKDYWPTKLYKKQIDWLNDFHRIKSDEFPKFE